MSKNIILLSDGTGNSAGKLFRTNVWRVYQALDLRDPKTLKDPRQFALYDDGVGSSSFKPLALLCGAVGIGLARNVRELYVFLCRIYEPGDRIYAFGFSRGAFTIRVLAGLILNQGLVPYDGNEAELNRLGRAAYRAYRHRYQTKYGLVRPLRYLRDKIIDACDRWSGKPTYAEVLKQGGPDAAEPVKIEFLGLWDTVDAYGLPVDELTRFIDRYLWPLRMPDLRLNRRVLHAMHALALDDERSAFHPRLWDEASEECAGRTAFGLPERRRFDPERIRQVWFAGVHANVGGGYPDDGLSYVSLEWIMAGAQKCGLRFCDKVWESYRALSDENAPIYDSRRGVAGYYRYQPRRIRTITRTSEVTVAGPLIHESVLRRIRVGHDGYAPIVLPPDFSVLRMDGTVVDGASYLDIDIGERSAFAAETEHVFNWVWWRRLAYFCTAAVTLALVAFPWLPLPVAPTPCEGLLCSVSASHAAHPGMFLLLLCMAAAGWRTGRRLEGEARDAMRRIWYGSARMKALKNARLPQAPGPVNSMVERLRTQCLYRIARDIFVRKLMPVLFLAMVAHASAVVVFDESGLSH